MTFLNYIKLDKTLPDLKYAHDEDGCFDFVSGIDIVIPANTKKPTMVPTGMKFEIPAGYELQVSLTQKLLSSGILLLNNKIVSNTSSETIFSVFNLSKEEIKLRKGEKIAHGKIFNYERLVLKNVE